MRREFTLAIEVSNPSAAEPGSGEDRSDVAVGEVQPDGSPRVMGVEPIGPDRRHDDDLVPAIDRLLRRFSLRPTDLARIAVSIGPGGFTGLRVGIASAKMIAETVGARCVAVPSAHVVARRVVSGIGWVPGTFAVALASKGDDTWVTVFSASGRERAAGRVMGTDEIRGLNVSAFVADRFLPVPIADVLRARGIGVTGAVFDAACCFEASIGLPDLDPADLFPLYPREPEAVRKWRELHPG